MFTYRALQLSECWECKERSTKSSLHVVQMSEKKTNFMFPSSISVNLTINSSICFFNTFIIKPK